MELDKLYSENNKLSDDAILAKYYALAMNKDDSMEKTIELATVVRISRERGLDITKQLHKEAKKEQKEKVNAHLKDFKKEGVRLLVSGVVVFLIGFGLTAATDGRMLFYGALIIGGFCILAGIFLLVFGTGLGAFAWWKLRK